jgi:hypothetical protein
MVDCITSFEFHKWNKQWNAGLNNCKSSIALMQDRLTELEGLVHLLQQKRDSVNAVKEVDSNQSSADEINKENGKNNS